MESGQISLLKRLSGFSCPKVPPLYAGGIPSKAFYDLAAHKIDGFRASILDERITWQLKSATALDDWEISRTRKDFTLEAKI